MLRWPRQLGNLASGFSSFEEKNGGGGGIRTPGTLRLSGFQDRRDRPLCHLSGDRENALRNAKLVELSSAAHAGIVARKTQHQSAPGGVAEIQGLYGPFSFPEKLFQKIWLRGDFDRSAMTLTDGRRIAVWHPGKWNLLGGPDFRGARLRLGDAPEFSGDVELHLHATDWAAHAHAKDRAYDGVALHVVLFPPPRGHVTVGADGREIPVLVLLPLLHHDLEEFAAEEAVELLAGRASQRLPEELFALDPAELAARLQMHAAERWRQKVHFARLRIRRLGWEAACHHAALEILGYRFNRAPMLRIAGRWPLREWVRGAVSSTEAFAAEKGAWQLQGVRPANHPRRRLEQYVGWTRQHPDWPAQLADLAAALPAISSAITTREARSAHGFALLRGKFAALSGETLGGPRLDNIICDGFLPLCAARTNQERPAQAVWFHWFPGDLPPRLARGLRQLGVCGTRSSPLAHGPAQGLLGWWIAREARG